MKALMRKTGKKMPGCSTAYIVKAKPKTNKKVFVHYVLNGCPYITVWYVSSVGKILLSHFFHHSFCFQCMENSGVYSCWLIWPMISNRIANTRFPSDSIAISPEIPLRLLSKVSSEFLIPLLSLSGWSFLDAAWQLIKSNKLRTLGNVTSQITSTVFLID